MLTRVDLERGLNKMYGLQLLKLGGELFRLGGEKSEAASSYVQASK